MNDSAPATGAQLPANMNATPAQAGPESSLAQNTRPIDVPTIASEGLERALTSRPHFDSPLRTDGSVPMTATTPTASEAVPPSGRIALNEPTNATAPTLQPAGPLSGTAYTVKASDTLSSIASAHYGTKSKQAVETIFDANRSVLTDMNNVKSGAVLMIPKLPGTAAEKSQPAPPPAPTTEKVSGQKKGSDKAAPEKKSADKEPAKKAHEAVAASEKNSKNIRWYQVQKNDRYASIARSQLGDAGRWQEVYELNKDKFPNPQHIREGVRIKLPAPMTLASAGKEKRR